MSFGNILLIFIIAFILYYSMKGSPCRVNEGFKCIEPGSNCYSLDDCCEGSMCIGYGYENEGYCTKNVQ